MVLSSFLSGSSFSNRSHFDNFVKYLFSQSAKHSENEHTNKNTYRKNNSPHLIYVDNATESYHNITSKIKKKFDCNLYTNSIIYFYFILEVNGKLISNFLEVDNNVVTGVSIDEETICEHYKTQNDFFTEIENIVSKHNEVIHFLDSKLEDRKIIDEKLHNMASQQQEGEVILAVSHNDQESPYHIHCIVKKK